LARVAGRTGLTRLAWTPGLSRSTRTARLSGLSGTTRFARGSAGAGRSISELTRSTRSTRISRSSRVAGRTTGSGAARIAGLSSIAGRTVVAGVARGTISAGIAGGTGRGIAGALGWEHVAVHGRGRSIGARLAHTSGETIETIDPVGTGFTRRSRGTTVAGTAASLATEGLTSVADELLCGLAPVANVDFAQEVELALPRDRDVSHLAPHVTGTRPAEIDLGLDGGLEGLDVVEDEGEGKETSRDSDR
jgi:hypothetical protein